MTCSAAYPCVAALPPALPSLTASHTHPRPPSHIHPLPLTTPTPTPPPPPPTLQKANLAPINDAVNGLLIEEEDYEGLRESITTHDNFDQVQLASRLEKHELTQMRRIAILIFKRNLRWKQALALCKRDGLWKDAIEVAAQVREIGGGCVVAVDYRDAIEVAAQVREGWLRGGCGVGVAAQVRGTWRAGGVKGWWRGGWQIGQGVPHSHSQSLSPHIPTDTHT